MFLPISPEGSPHFVSVPACSCEERLLFYLGDVTLMIFCTIGYMNLFIFISSFNGVLRSGDKNSVCPLFYATCVSESVNDAWKEWITKWILWDNKIVAGHEEGIHRGSVATWLC